MKTHNLIQGTKEWLEFRASHNTASEAPAMMGESTYQTRNELLKAKATGITPDIDEATQRRFNDGHHFEELARPLAEQIVGEELYPVVGSKGDLSASFDGITLLGDVIWEHKTLNNTLRNCRDNGAELPLMYQIQIEQQLMVSGATKALFTASKFNDDGSLAEPQLITWYEPNKDLAAKIVAGWAQFESDLANYKPEAPKLEVVASNTENLPTVFATVQGNLTVQSNLDVFGVALNDFINQIPKEPTTDQEFADTEAACKTLKKAEDALGAAEDQALASLSSVEELRRTVADLRNIARTTRLASEKLVKARKEAIRLEIVTTAITMFKAFVSEQSKGLSVATQYPTPDFGGAIKGLRTLSSIQDRVDTTMANAKIEAVEYFTDIKTKLGWFDENVAPGYQGLFRDLSSLVEMSLDNFKSAVTGRVEEHKRIEAERLEQERKRIEEQARVKAEREAQAKLEAQQAAAISAETSKTPDPQPEPIAAVSKEKPTIQDEFISVSRAHYEQLQADAKLLHALIEAGVESWKGWTGVIKQTEAA